MNNDITTLRPADHILDRQLRLALTGRPVRRKVWVMLIDETHPHRAEPLLVVVRIVADKETGLAWHPVRGKTIGADSREVDVETLRGDQVWWGPFARRFARSRLRVERQQLRRPDHGQGVEVDRVERILQGLERYEKQVVLAAVDGDRQLRVVAEFPAPRGYGDA